MIVLFLKIKQCPTSNLHYFNSAFFFGIWSFRLRQVKKIEII